MLSRFVVIAVIMLLLGSVTMANQSNIDESQTSKARVHYVIDGDTLKLQGHEQRVRLWGVDAPERGERGFHNAINALQLYAGQGTKLIVTKIDIDRYQRLVARIHLEDGREVNRLLIESGVAKEYCRYSRGEYGRCNANN